jgi:glycine/D-amino acid oxidase-like deaminating enzyme
MRVAILGGGFLGVCTALECVRRGLVVDLYERADALITQAGLVNEGKVHLGFVYANDLSMRTAARLIRSAVSFQPLLGRWLDLNATPLALSPPFDYVVPHESALSPAQVEQYFTSVARLVEEHERAMGAPYLGHASSPVFKALPQRVREAGYDARRVQAAYSTIERAVDAEDLAARLRAAIAGSATGVRCGCPVREVKRRPDGGFLVEYSVGAERRSESYDVVVNTAWAGRLAIDETMGLLPRRPWLYRFKFGVTLRIPWQSPRPPTMTMVHGPFGDIVEFPGGRTYLSWYPAGMVGTSGATVPPQWDAEIGAARRADIITRSIEALADVCPSLRDLPAAVRASSSLRGGVIFAWGATDISDAGSELHQRFDIGITTSGLYYSVDPGKYTTVPMYAVEVCDRIVAEA